MLTAADRTPRETLGTLAYTTHFHVAPTEQRRMLRFCYARVAAHRKGASCQSQAAFAFSLNIWLLGQVCEMHIESYVKLIVA